MSSAESPTSRKRLVLLGCTGSIGVNTLHVVRHLAPAYEVVGLAAGNNIDLLAQQAADFGVKHVAVAKKNGGEQSLSNRLPDARVYVGPEAAAQLIDAVEADVLVGAVVGAAGLPATLRAIEKGMTIALANKETLVAAGELVIPLARKHRVDLLPIDSEHSAIFQCLQAKGQVKRIVLTASGGPFRRATKQQIDHATVEQALAHPTWNMGRKITIDSATMMNKALEIIEAHWLFGLRAEQIQVIIHPQSIIHSFVEFEDHSILAQLGPPDMRTPIQYALTWPHRAPGSGTQIDWTKLNQLDFEQADFDRFPALKLAYHVIERGGTSGAVLNAANEAAVAAFLDGRIRFGQITQLTAQAMDAITPIPVRDLKTVLYADAQARRFVADHVGN